MRLRPQHRGFSLVELMAVVMIMSVLGTVAMVSMRRHSTAAQAAEGLAVVQAIRVAQERYRAHEGSYLNVSQASWYPRNPVAGGVDGSAQTTFFQDPVDGAHVDNARWQLLNPTVRRPVRFGYMTTAGSAGDPLTEPLDGVAEFPAVDDPWFVIQAIADLDDDDAYSYVLASSIHGEVYQFRNGE